MIYSIVNFRVKNFIELVILLQVIIFLSIIASEDFSIKLFKNLFLIKFENKILHFRESLNCILSCCSKPFTQSLIQTECVSVNNFVYKSSSQNDTDTCKLTYTQWSLIVRRAVPYGGRRTVLDYCCLQVSETPMNWNKHSMPINISAIILYE